MSKEALTQFITGYIASRRQSKLEAFEKDVKLFDYLDRIEKNQLSPEEKKGRQELYGSIGFKKEK